MHTQINRAGVEDLCEIACLACVVLGLIFNNTHTFTETVARRPNVHIRGMFWT